MKSSSPPNHLSDSALEPHLERLLRIARRILGCDSEAWDAVQEALVSLWHEDPFPPNPPAWLIQTVIHRSLHARRCRMRRRRNEEKAGVFRALSITAEDPDHAIECEELRKRLDRAIGELAEEYRSVFLLREVEGLDYAAIARHVAVPIGTVRSRIHRARSKLQELLSDLAPSADRQLA
jgi:RNA polymerase sigma-70 factor (ECF subfamily)